MATWALSAYPRVLPLLGVDLEPDVEWAEVAKYLGPHNSPSKFYCPTFRAERRILTFSGLFSWPTEPCLSVSVTIILIALATFFSTEGPPEEFFLISVSFLFFLVYNSPPEFLVSSSRMGRFKLLCFSTQFYLVFAPSRAHYLAPKGLVLP